MIITTLKKHLKKYAFWIAFKTESAHFGFKTFILGSIVFYSFFFFGFNGKINENSC